MARKNNKSARVCTLLRRLKAVCCIILVRSLKTTIPLTSFISISIKLLAEGVPIDELWSLISARTKEQAKYMPKCQTRMTCDAKGAPSSQCRKCTCTLLALMRSRVPGLWLIN